MCPCFIKVLQRLRNPYIKTRSLWNAFTRFLTTHSHHNCIIQFVETPLILPPRGSAEKRQLLHSSRGENEREKEGNQDIINWLVAALMKSPSLPARGGGVGSSSSVLGSSPSSSPLTTRASPLFLNVVGMIDRFSFTIILFQGPSKKMEWTLCALKSVTKDVGYV